MSSLSTFGAQRLPIQSPASLRQDASEEVVSTLREASIWRIFRMNSRSALPAETGGSLSRRVITGWDRSQQLLRESRPVIRKLMLSA